MSAHDLDLARIGPDDWEEFREVRLHSLADSPAAFGSRHEDWVSASEERWRARLSDVPLTIVARHDGRPVGVVSGSPDAAGVELISMWVAPALRGSGLGRTLIDTVVTWAAAQGHGTFLMVRSDNARALAAYVGAGFVDQGVTADHPADAPPEHRMVHAPRSRPAG